jgi:hypothetical protein
MMRINLSLLATHCRHGHLRTAENTYASNGGCKLCQLARTLARCRRVRATPEGKAYNRKRAKEWAENNREKSRARTKRNNKSHKVNRTEMFKASRKAHSAARRVRNRKMKGENFTGGQWLRLKKLYSNCCVCCGRTEQELKLLGLCSQRIMSSPWSMKGRIISGTSNRCATHFRRATNTTGATTRKAQTILITGFSKASCPSLQPKVMWIPTSRAICEMGQSTRIRPTAGVGDERPVGIGD